MKRETVLKIARLSGCKNFVGERKFTFDAFVDLEPVERFENGSDMCGLMSLNKSASKRVLNLLEPVKLTVWKVMIESVTVVTVELRTMAVAMYTGCFEVKIWADKAKFTNVIIARFRKCGDLVRAAGVGCSERGVVYFRELLFKSNNKKFSFRRVESEKIGSHPGTDLL